MIQIFPPQFFSGVPPWISLGMSSGILTISSKISLEIPPMILQGLTPGFFFQGIPLEIPQGFSSQIAIGIPSKITERIYMRTPLEFLQKWLDIPLKVFPGIPLLSSKEILDTMVESVLFRYWRKGGDCLLMIENYQFYEKKKQATNQMKFPVHPLFSPQSIHSLWTVHFCGAARADRQLCTTTCLFYTIQWIFPP